MNKIEQVGKRDGIMEHIAILGAGSWGTALAVHLGRKGYNVKLWGRNPEHIDSIIRESQNKRYLPNINLSPHIEPTAKIEEAVATAEIVVLSVPSQAVRSIVKTIKPLIKPGAILVNTAKGLEETTLLRLSQVIEEETENKHELAVLSGPSHAEEVAQFLPTAIVVAAKKRWVAERIQDLFMSSSLRVYTNPDLCGVEIGGALKNVIALATGIADGLGYGDNTRAALITRGLAEISRLGIHLKAEPLTFAGLAGIGDLIVTCNSMHSRNRRAGILLGQGESLDNILNQMGMVVEGVNTTKAAMRLAQNLGVEMPITREIYKVLYQGKAPQQSVKDLMERQKTNEVEEVACKLQNW